VASEGGVERIARAFAERRRAAALMPYLMAGYPTPAASRAVLAAVLDCGVDLLELGVPYSDPLADGPVIHQAATAALAAGTTVKEVFALAEQAAEHTAVVVMAYANLLLVHGVEHFARAAAASGVAGVIVPDLPAEEAGEIKEALAAAGLALPMLVAPNTRPNRLARIGATASGFLYAVSVLGTTGERPPEELRYAEVVSLCRRAADLPVAVGFGIASARHAALAVEAGADGVIVGSRLVRAAGEGERAVAAALAEIAAGLEVAARR